MLDGARQVVVWAVVTRHKSLPLPPLPLPPPPTDPARAQKTTGLPLEERVRLLRGDFEKRQYYVTGRLSQAIYHDACLFDGPDPDVPVVGLRKYVSATAGLFDRARSRVDLLGIECVGEAVVAKWRLEGALNLPWKPRIKPYTGETTYTFGDDGLVVSHVETWSVTALDAFVSVLWPAFGRAPAPPVEVLRLEERRRKEEEEGREEEEEEEEEEEDGALLAPAGGGLLQDRY